MKYIFRYTLENSWRLRETAYKHINISGVTKNVAVP